MKKFGFSYRRRAEEQLADQLNDHLQETLDASEDALFSFADFDAESAERTGYSDYSYWGSTLRAFFQNKAAVFFLVVMLVVVTGFASLVTVIVTAPVMEAPAMV